MIHTSEIVSGTLFWTQPCSLQKNDIINYMILTVTPIFNYMSILVKKRNLMLGFGFLNSSFLFRKIMNLTQITWEVKLSVHTEGTNLCIYTK